MIKNRQRVYMKCTREQWETDLEVPLTQLGYEIKVTDARSEFTEYPLLVNDYNNFESYDSYRQMGVIDMCATRKANIVLGDAIYIKEYNPELYIALAALHLNSDIHVGEWVWETWTTSPDYNKRPFRVLDIKQGIATYSRWWHNGLHCRNELENFRKATAAELIEYFTDKNKTTMDRFPFKLSAANAKRIHSAACDAWKRRLASEWGPGLLTDDFVMITEDKYKEMREACTDDQNVLFDDIFGRDEEACPYKDGELIFVKDDDDDGWQLRYATGRMNGKLVVTYGFQKKSGFVVNWKYHAPAPGVKLPR